MAPAVSLDGAQFRCAGSSEYIAWLESVLSGAPVDVNRRSAEIWFRKFGTEVGTPVAPATIPDPSILDRRAAEEAPLYGVPQLRLLPPPAHGFDFRLFDEPETWEASLRDLALEGNSVRLLSSYSRKWKTAPATNPHNLPPEMMDFHEEYQINGERRYWSRIWNFVPNRGTNYTWFVTGHPGGMIAYDQLCEVGCPYAVRGFDYDYVGIIWLDDLIWRNGSWQVQPECVHETGVANLANAAANEAEPGAITTALLEKVYQAYRILFSRAIKGVYVWIPDRETRSYIQDSLA